MGHSRSATRLMRASLLAGVAALGLAAPAPAAHAQTPAPAADDGLSPQTFYLEADEVIANDTDQTVTARGGVEVRYNGRTLRANEIVYDRKSGVVTARGETTIVNPDGTTQFADAIILDDQLRAGIATGFSTRIGQDVKIAAASAVRRSESVNELNKAIYTPCPVCVDEDGTTKGPTWSLRAEKVVQDRDRKIVYYRNATLMMFGAPILYTPVFWHADPTVKRQSGLLAPSITASRRRGLSYEQPYLQVISPSQDLVISPQFNTEVNPFLNLTWRKRFWTGEAHARVGYTYEADLRGDGDRFGEQTSRSYILADGAFDITPFWRWGFSAERASDDLIFDKYEIDDVYVRRGLFGADDRRLTSQLYVARQDQRSYLSIAAVSIQGLRSTDIDRTFPLVAPLVEARWEPSGPVMGGRMRLSGSGVVLTRDQSQALGSSAGDAGIDSRRATAQADWRANHVFASGLRVSPFAALRGDLYSISDLPGDEDVSEGRLAGVAGVDITWPFFRRDEGRTIVLEPIVQLAVSPDTDPIVIGYDGDGPIYFNEDSIALEFDETNLFATNRFPGFDLYEGGRRMNVGGRASVLYDDGRSASLLIGRSYRDEPDDAFAARSGLQTRASDWIVAGEATPFKGLSVFSRARLDSDDGAVRRIEAGADLEMARGRGFIRYLRDNEDITGFRREDVDFAGDILLVGHWGVTFRGVHDLERDVWRRQEFGALYQDDCLDFRVVWVHEETFNRALGPSDAVQVRLSLATIGR